ncbi:MAG: hypothetical protein R2691_03665 [Solirubrobacterales bacterium]
MTLAWLVIWFIANLVGGSEPLTLDPVNGWTGTLILAIALDLNRPASIGGRKGGADD